MADNHFEIIYFLTKSDMFKRVSRDLLDLIASEASTIKFKKNDYVLVQNEPVRYLYIVSYGVLHVVVNETIVAGGITVGDILGDQEIVAGNQEAEASVQVASEYAWLICIPRTVFLQVIENEPSFMHALVKTYSNRRWMAKQRLDNNLKLSSRLNRGLNKFENLLQDVENVAYERKKNKKNIVELRYVVEIQNGSFEFKSKKHIQQGYLVIDDKNEIRVRFANNIPTISAKKDYGEDRINIELEIDKSMFQVLYKYAENRIVSKTRYLYPFENYEWRIDVFDADTQCKGLVIAEVEINKGDLPPQLPPGLTMLSDITGKNEYRNQKLALVGVPDQP